MPRLIALLYEATVHGSQEAFCRGFATACRDQDWRMHLVGSASKGGIEEALRLEAAAIVGPLGRSDLACAARDCGIPAVNVYGGAQLAGLPQVGISDRAIGTMAGRDLISRGYRHLAYIGFRHGTDREGVDKQRLAGLRHIADEYGLSVQESTIRDRGLVDWLCSLPEPCGLVCVDDPIAATIILAAERHALSIPDRLALLGINNHHLLCELSHPPLASIELGAERLGSEAVDLVARQLDGRAIDTPVRMLQPLRVHARGSIGISRGLPPVVRQALSLIDADGWRHCDPERIARAVGRNRRVLDNAFRQHLGCTVFARLRERLVIEIQLRLSSATGTSVTAIAEELGFSSPSYLNRLFRTVTGQTPVQWRRGAY
ncbi:MAG: substrate-binding domain-containing protein [Planctomycetota bacterium]